MEIYKDIEKKYGFKYHRPPVDTAYGNWLKEITNPKTGKPYNGKPIQDEVHQIFRLKDINGDEKLAWTGHWISENRWGNRKTFATGSHGPQGSWIKPIFNYEKIFDHQTLDTVEQVTQEIRRETKYDVPFTKEAAERLRKKATRPDGKPVQLIIYDERKNGTGGKERPVAIHDWDDFVSKDFDNLIATGFRPVKVIVATTPEAAEEALAAEAAKTEAEETTTEK
jgi:hypothetical protein